MGTKAKQILEGYLNITYARRDTAAILREARRALMNMLQAQSVQIYLFKNSAVFCLCSLSDGSYRLEPVAQSVEQILAQAQPLVLNASEAQGVYGAVCVHGSVLPVCTEPMAVKLCRVLSEQLYKNLATSELDLMVHAGKTLVPADGGLPAETLAVLAHEMRAPLATALASLEVLRKRLHMNQQSEGYSALCDTLENNLRRSMRMSTNLLLAYKGDRESPPLELLNATQILYHAAESAKPYAQQQGVTLNIALQVHPSAERMMLSNRQYLESIAMNLLSNAMRHASRECGMVEVEIAQTEQELMLNVHDNGAGFSPQTAERLFEKFWRDASCERVHHHGAGLGLYLVSVFVRALGGVVRADGSHGGKFSVRLPMKRQEPPSCCSHLSSYKAQDDPYWNTAENEFVQ